MVLIILKKCIRFWELFEAATMLENYFPGSSSCQSMKLITHLCQALRLLLLLWGIFAFLYAMYDIKMWCF
jgi:hypothetical protein